MPKKPLYAGDPNATLTMCYKKRRRHTSNDFDYAVVKSEPVPGTNPKGMAVIIICKHCKQTPFPPSEPEAQPARTR